MVGIGVRPRFDMWRYLIWQTYNLMIISKPLKSNNNVNSIPRSDIGIVHYANCKFSISFLLTSDNSFFFHVSSLEVTVSDFNALIFILELVTACLC